MSSGYGFAAFAGGVTWIGQPRQTRGTNGRKPRTVVNFSVAVSKDRFNEETKEWEQDAGGKYYESVTAFGRLADNIIASLKPGDRVVVIGDRDPKPPYTDRNGRRRRIEDRELDGSGPLLAIYPPCGQLIGSDGHVDGNVTPWGIVGGTGFSGLSSSRIAGLGLAASHCFCTWAALMPVSRSFPCPSSSSSESVDPPEMTSSPSSSSGFELESASAADLTHCLIASSQSF